MSYTEAEVLRLARRQGNNKRGYLLVNPLQAKHMPARPSAALAMMEHLAEALAASYPDTALVIGFAETATAIGAVVAAAFGERCRYLHTTREESGTDGWVQFQEEHSHAVEQTLCVKELPELLGRGQRILFVDDEMTTGKTLLNVLSQLRAAVPALAPLPVTAACLLDRLTAEHRRRLRDAGVESAALVKLPYSDYRAALDRVQTHAPAELRTAALPQCKLLRLALREELPNPRIPLPARAYWDACWAGAAEACRLAEPYISKTGELLVLGTEECMLPALLLGRELEQKGYSVFCHATTRSPIGVSSAPGYPIHTGYRVDSFYDPARESYLYNLRRYESVLVLSDARREAEGALADLAKAAGIHACGQVIYLAGGAYV